MDNLVIIAWIMGFLFFIALIINGIIMALS